MQQRPGQVLYSKLRPYLNKFARPEFDGVCSSEIWVLEGKEVENDYLFYLIQGNRFRKAANISSGSKMPRASWKVVSSTAFDLPTKETQRRIATFLRALDDRLTLVERQLECTEAFKRGLLQQMFV
jgi:type I restriction enzyme S subunit